MRTHEVANLLLSIGPDAPTGAKSLDKTAILDGEDPKAMRADLIQPHVPLDLCKQGVFAHDKEPCNTL